MSNWVYIDCIFRDYSSGNIPLEAKERHIKYGRNLVLKKLYKVLSKIQDVAVKNGHDKDDLKFKIIPIFRSRITEYGRYDFDDEIVVNIFGTLRCDTNSDNRYTNLIEDIWYKSDLYIKHGVCLITDNYFGEQILTYDFSKKIIKEV